MNTDLSREQWYALQLRTRWESSTATLLAGKGYQTFLPTYKTLKRVRGKSCEANSPLFPGYVFCRFDAHRRLPVLLTPGVIGVVGSGRIPIPVEDSEIEAIQTVVSTGFQAEPWPYLEVGQLVRIDDGALCGVQGILIGFKGARRIVVSISLLRRSVALEIDRSVVCAIQPSLAVPAGPLPFSPLLEPAVANY
jgi:transcription antitermination factor NusG